MWPFVCFVVDLPGKLQINIPRFLRISERRASYYYGSSAERTLSSHLAVMQGQFDLSLFSVALESCEEVYIIYYNIGALDKQEYSDVEDDSDKESNN